MTPEQRVELADKRAFLTRSRLFRAIDALDARRYELEGKVREVGREAREVAEIGFWAMLGFACVAVVGTGIGLSMLAFRRKRRWLR